MTPDALLIPAMSAECEHVFSGWVVFIIIRFLDRIGWFLNIFSAKSSVTNRRNSLQYTTIGATEYLKSWAKGGLINFEKRATDISTILQNYKQET